MSSDLLSTRFRYALLVLLASLTALFPAGSDALPHDSFVHTTTSTDSGWKAGVATEVITPDESMWMAGYAVRDREAEGKQHDLYAKALALEDTEGNRVLLVTTDLLGIPTALSNRIRDRIGQAYGLDRSAILLNSSHTHSAPVLEGALLDIYPLNEERMQPIHRYTAILEDQIVDLAGRALDRLAPASVSSANGTARFQVNRRNNDAETLHLQTDLNGPIDHAVPVIKVTSPNGELQAIAFGYACHPTVLDGYEWSGDYPGYAQIELEKLYPGTTALFFQGAGADQNPLPRRETRLAIQYGKTLAASVEAVVSGDMKELSPTLSHAYSEVELPLRETASREYLEQLADESLEYIQRWAKRILKEMDEGKEFARSYPYPVQSWMIGEQPVFSLGGELTVGYANKLKQMYGPDIFVMGYSNDVTGYIPTTRILKEGGYEGHSSHKVYGLPAPWTPDTETMIFQQLIQVAKKAEVPHAPPTRDY